VNNANCEFMKVWLEDGSWLHLFNKAHKMLNDVSSHLGDYPMDACLGGGTRLMLLLQHRVSHDVDIFIHDAQILGYFAPRLSSFIPDNVLSYDEDSNYVKLKFDDGEIDIIVSPNITGKKPEFSESLNFYLESPTEVIAKNLYYRGNSITARDVFDWRSLSSIAPDALDYASISPIIQSKLSGITESLKGMSDLPHAKKAWNSIITPYPLDMKESIDWAIGEIEVLARIGTTASTKIKFEV